MLEGLDRSVYCGCRPDRKSAIVRHSGARMTTRKTGALPFACIASMLWLALVPPAAAQPMADYFRGKTLKLLTPSVPGGDRALYSLAFASFFGKHVPGNPAIQPVFMPGAGGSTAV